MMNANPVVIHRTLRGLREAGNRRGTYIDNLPLFGRILPTRTSSRSAAWLGYLRRHEGEHPFDFATAAYR
jgi:hypothetical protein